MRESYKRHPYILHYRVGAKDGRFYAVEVEIIADAGAFSPQVNFAMEELADMAAEKLGISPVEFRRRNMVRQGSVTVTGQALSSHEVTLEKAMDRVLAAANLCRCTGYQQIVDAIEAAAGEQKSDT